MVSTEVWFVSVILVLRHPVSFASRSATGTFAPSDADNFLDSERVRPVSRRILFSNDIPGGSCDTGSSRRQCDVYDMRRSSPPLRESRSFLTSAIYLTSSIPSALSLALNISSCSGSTMGSLEPIFFHTQDRASANSGASPLSLTIIRIASGEPLTAVKPCATNTGSDSSGGGVPSGRNCGGKPSSGMNKNLAAPRASLIADHSVPVSGSTAQRVTTGIGQGCSSTCRRSSPCSTCGR